MRRRSFNAWPWLFLAPALVGFALFFAWPIARVVRLSLTRDGGWSTQRFAPVENYGFTITDPFFWLATVNTIVFAVGFAVVQIPLSLGAAMLVERMPVRLRVPTAGVFFSTHLVGATFAGALFAALLSGRGGINGVLLGLGLIDRPVLWLDTPALVMPLLVGIAAYLGFGFGMVYCLSALRRVDRDLYAAARVEGAGPMRLFWHVTLPQVRPTLAFLFVAAVFWGLQAFELPYLLFGGPGPGYRALTGVMLLFALGFERGDWSHAAAVSVLFGGIVIGLTVLLAAFLRIGREEVTIA
jgi:ABC-type sugar transport system permease subunit